MTDSYKVVGEGSFGCIIEPSLKCQNKKISYKNKVSKVLISKEAKNELNEYSVIGKIDKKNKYHLGKPTKCKIKKTKKALKAISRCNKLLNKYTKDKSLKKHLSDFELLIMTHGGVSLKQFSGVLVSMDDTPKNREIAQKLWFQMKNIFEGISVFQKHNIAHFDIKLHNIVYNVDKNDIKFIDFGHMGSIKDAIKKGLNSDFWLFDSAHWSYPLEVQFMNKNVFQKFSKMNSKQIDSWFNSIVGNIVSKNDDDISEATNTFLHYISKYSSQDYSENIQKKYLSGFYDFLKNSLKINKYKHILEKSAYSVDVFSLGMSCMELLHSSQHLIHSYIVDDFELLFYNMFNPDIENRFSIQESLSQFENILDKWK